MFWNLAPRELLITKQEIAIFLAMQSVIWKWGVKMIRQSGEMCVKSTNAACFFNSLKRHSPFKLWHLMGVRQQTQTNNAQSDRRHCKSFCILPSWSFDWWNTVVEVLSKCLTLAFWTIVVSTSSSPHQRRLSLSMCSSKRVTYMYTAGDEQMKR